MRPMPLPPPVTSTDFPDFRDGDGGQGECAGGRASIPAVPATPKSRGTVRVAIAMERKTGSIQDLVSTDLTDMKSYGRNSELGLQHSLRWRNCPLRV